jgi:uncharacterized protein YndB with AHSA1/START domain
LLIGAQPGDSRAAMEGPTITASMLIRRGPTEIFDAFADPDVLCRFWLDAASGPLEPGAVVEWRFKVPGVSDTVTVTRFDRPRALSFRFSDGQDVTMTFDFHGGDATRVSVHCTNFSDGDLLAQATSTAEGYALVLSDLKTLLETGRSANLVRDKAELITQQRAQQGGG